MMKKELKLEDLELVNGGFDVDDLLGGFKYIWNRVKPIEDPQNDVVIKVLNEYEKTHGWNYGEW